MSLIYNRTAFFLLIFFMCLSGCREDAAVFGDKVIKNYSIYIMGKDGKEYILETNSLDSGTLAPEKDGAEVNIKVIDRNIIVKNGYYYHYDRKTSSFLKYVLEGKSLNPAGSLPLAKFSIENYRWLGGDTLLLTGLSTPDFAQVKYVLFTTGNMKKIAGGNMEIPMPSGRFDNMSIGFVTPRNGKLLVGYTYHQQLSISDYATSDTTYISVLNFPQMTQAEMTKDWRSTYPGGINTVQTSSFSDERGDFYFMDCPGIALGNRPELFTAILRINKDRQTPDKSYFFNFSAAVGNHAYGMWYLGGHQALIRAERKDLFRGLGDHYSTPHFEFYLTDLSTSKVIRKLDLPLDKGTRRECVIVKNDIAYISVNSPAEGNFIWIYNIRTGALKKGLELAGNTNFMLRIDKLR